MSKSLELSSVKESLFKVLRVLNNSRGFVFFILVALLYGFIVWRIDTLANAEPTEEQLQTAEASAKSPRIDSQTVNKIYNLKDNSVRVQALFEEGRNNPFQE